MSENQISLQGVNNQEINQALIQNQDIPDNIKIVVQNDNQEQDDSILEQKYKEQEEEVIEMRKTIVKGSKISQCLLEEDPAGDALKMQQNSAFKNSLNRSPAIFITMALELIVATVIDSFTETISKNALLVAFMPVISAISGNVGLQSSSINVRALALGIIHEKQMCRGVLTQLYISVYMGLYSGVVLGIIAGIWQQLKPGQSDSGDDPSDYQGWYAVKFGFVMFGCQWLAAISAGVFGAWSPLLFKRFKVDPGNIAGPLETAFQDIVGYTTLLVIASQIL